MQTDVKKHIRNVALFANSPPAPMPGKRGPDKYTGKQHEYFETPTVEYVYQNAKYASNYFKAQVQGIIPGTFETERGAYIRSMDIVEQTTGAKMPNDYQCIYFQDTRIRGLYTGAKVKYAGNTWLAISPFNIADPMTRAVVRRCNAVWKHYDYYGNILSEPFIFHDGRASATANEYLDYDVIPNWYQKCVMQLNDNTRELAYNRRIVLGSSVVEVRGLVDFITDFSGQTKEDIENPEPSHVMFFDVQFEPPTEYDDMEKGIAGGKAFSWVILPSCASEMSIGAEQILSVSSLRNNEAPDEAKHPVSYLFSSSDSSVATIDLDGKVTAIGEGSTTITVALEQNPDITATIEVSVVAQSEQAEFVFEPEIPDKLKQMQNYSGAVYVKRGSEVVQSDITVEVYGAKEEAEVTFDKEIGELIIACYEPSQTAMSLVFNDSINSLVFTKNIQLEGY